MFICTPNNLSFSILSSWVSLRVTYSIISCSDRDARFCQVVISIALVLDAFTIMWLSLHHSDTDVISLFSFVPRSFTVVAVYVTEESSAIISQSLFSICKGKSFMKSMQNMCPKIEPCGTPHVIVDVLESFPLNLYIVIYDLDRIETIW